MSDKLDLRRIATEQRNPRTAHIDELPTIDMVRLINSEDKKVAEAVELQKRVDKIAEGAALMTGTSYDRVFIDGAAELLRQILGEAIK